MINKAAKNQDKGGCNEKELIGTRLCFLVGVLQFYRQRSQRPGNPSAVRTVFSEPVPFGVGRKHGGREVTGAEHHERKKRPIDKEPEWRSTA